MSNEWSSPTWDKPEGLLAFIYHFLYDDEVRTKITRPDTLEGVMNDFNLSDDAKALFRQADGKPLNNMYAYALAAMVGEEIVTNYPAIYERCW